MHIYETACNCILINELNHPKDLVKKINDKYVVWWFVTKIQHVCSWQLSFVGLTFIMVL